MIRCKFTIEAINKYTYIQSFQNEPVYKLQLIGATFISQVFHMTYEVFAELQIWTDSK